MSKQNLVQRKTSCKYIVFQVRFLLDRYHGREWPPSPRRFFLAMVAALHQSSRRRVDITLGIDALKFLEKLAPPTIYAPHKQIGHHYMLFVPNNDLDVVKKQDLKNVLTNRTFQMSKVGTKKNAKPHIVNGIVQYLWEISTSESNLDRHVNLLTQIAKEITVLGWGIDPVTVNCKIADIDADVHGTDCYRYDEHSSEDLIAIPISGLFEDAKRHYEEWRTRIQNATFRQPNPITKSVSVPYRKERHMTYDIKGFIIKQVDNNNEQALKTRMQVIPQECIGEIIHQIDSEKNKITKTIVADSEYTKIKTVPLPSIGSDYADAQIRRIGFLIPSYMQAHIKNEISFLDGKIIKLGKKKWQLKLLKEDDSVLKMYTRKSKAWCSITPAELNIKCGANRNEVVGSVLSELQDIAAEIEFINFRREPYWNNLPKISNCHNDKFQTYIDIEFKTPTKGPFVIGNAQHDGKGMFAPKDLPNIAYFALCDHIPIENCITVGNQMRMATMSKSRQKFIPATISGHEGSERAKNHQHAFWLPLDTNNDGLINSITVYLPSGFNNAEGQTFYNIDRLFGNNDIKTKLIFRGFFSKKKISKKIPIFSSAYEWKSATPYFMPWHSKRKFGVKEQVEKECRNRGLPKPKIVSSGVWLQPGFKNHRAKKFTVTRNNQLPPNTIGHYLAIKFPEKIHGPLNLGYGCHFGLGMFIPS